MTVVVVVVVIISTLFAWLTQPPCVWTGGDPEACNATLHDLIGLNDESKGVKGQREVSCLVSLLLCSLKGSRAAPSLRTRMEGLLSELLQVEFRYVRGDADGSPSS